MRTVALLLSVILASSATPVRAEEPAPAAQQTTVVKQRGFLTSLGLGLLIGGLAGIGLGIGSTINSNEKQAYLLKYMTVDAAEQSTVDLLNQSAKDFSTLAAVGFIVGGLALAGGIVCLAADTPRTSIAFVPTSQGGVFVFSGRF